MKTIKSLAEFVSTKRDKLGLSPTGLARKANIDLKTIENIEAGQDLFLATTVRQKLARALKCENATIKALEKQPKNKNEVSLDQIEAIKTMVLNEETEDLKCPVCKETLICRVAKMYDLEDNLQLHPKARCIKCPFQIK